MLRQQRAKDVRLHRAQEELEKYRTKFFKGKVFQAESGWQAAYGLCNEGHLDLLSK